MNNKGSSAQGTKGNRHGNHFNLAANTERAVIQRAFQIARKNDAAESQNGPVRIIIKDGKPVETANAGGNA